MDIKALVTLALENRTPDEKIALACKLIGMNPLAYQHLDNGRKSMTAGNMLRGWLKRDENAVGLLQAECGLTDIELDAAPAPGKADFSSIERRMLAHMAAGTKPDYSINTGRIPRSEPVDSNYKRTADGTECIPYGANALFARGVVGNYA